MKKKLLLSVLITLSFCFAKTYANAIREDYYIKKDTILPKINLNNSTKNKKDGFVVTANYGLAFRVAGTPNGLTSEQENYVKKLKSGSSYDLSAYYMRSSEGGFGLKYNVYNSTGSLGNQSVKLNDGTGTVIVGSISDNIKISYFGPSFIMTEKPSAKTGEAILEISLGYLSYVDNGMIIGTPLKISGSTFGMVGGMGYHFRINPHFLLGGQANFIGGTLTKLKYTYADGSTETISLKKDEFESLWRIDLVIGAKFRF